MLARAGRWFGSFWPFGLESSDNGSENGAVGASMGAATKDGMSRRERLHAWRRTERWLVNRRAGGGGEGSCPGLGAAERAVMQCEGRTLAHGGIVLQPMGLSAAVQRSVLHHSRWSCPTFRNL